jgi:bifunctional UDP-N-acetylglucosamine pyrophosphorylase/glucosamine-1-phosphate N-acetyltransferase
MTVPSPFLALVIAPEDGSVLAADLAGKAAGDYLIDRLAAASVAARTVIVTDAGAVSADEIAGDLLVIDARAWVSELALGRAAEQAVRERRSVYLAATGTGASAVDPRQILALWLPAVANATRPSWSGSGVDRRVLGAFLASPGVADSAVPLDPGPDERVRCLDSMMTLADLEETVLLGRAYDALKRGVRIRDPRHVYLRGRLACGADVEIDVGVVIEGDVTLGDGVRIGAHAILRNATVGDRTKVKPFSMVEDSTIGAACQVGPFARLRPGTAVGDFVQVGNYVETKSSRIGNGSRINHHSFIGDAEVGENTTIGAGTITCNHDGVGVARTIIERGAYIGSGCRLVAPVRIGHDATVGAGSTITHDVPPARLTVARARQVTIERWHGPGNRRKPE